MCLHTRLCAPWLCRYPAWTARDGTMILNDAGDLDIKDSLRISNNSEGLVSVKPAACTPLKIGKGSILEDDRDEWGWS